MSVRNRRSRLNRAASAVALAAVTFVVGVTPARANANPANEPANRAESPSAPALIDALRETEVRSRQLVEYGHFGQSLAVDGDTAVIGEPRGTGPGPETGVAWVYVKSGDNWELQAKLTDPDLREFSEFGRGVAIDGDTIVVGAPGALAEGVPARHPGAAYVFVRSGGSWTQQAELYTEDGTLNIGYGDSVDVEGDTAVVGADLEARLPNTSYAGAVYVYGRAGTSWGLQKKMVSDDGKDDFFGTDVSLSGDWLAVGASKDSSPTTVKAGAVYMYQRAGSTWTRQVKLFASAQKSLTYFGIDVDVDDDTLVVGTQGGRHAYVYLRSGSTWKQQAILSSPGPDAGDLFGYSVAVDGSTILVGDTSADTKASDFSGAMYAFTRSGTVWSPRKKIAASDGRSGDSFGARVAYDGVTSLIGATYKDAPDGTRDVGAAYFYQHP